MLTWAGARVHDGILFSSVRIENRSSAEAMNVASTETVAVLTAFASAFFTTGFDAAAVVDADGERVGAPAAEGTAAVSR